MAKIDKREKDTHRYAKQLLSFLEWCRFHFKKTVLEKQSSIGSILKKLDEKTLWQIWMAQREPKMKGIKFYLRDDSKRVITEHAHGKESERGADKSERCFDLGRGP